MMNGVAPDKIAEIQENGYCVLREHFAARFIDACRDAFAPESYDLCFTRCILRAIQNEYFPVSLI